MTSLPPTITFDPPHPKRLREVLGAFPTGVTVVTTTHDGRPYGMTANSFTSVSLEPALTLVCLRRRSNLITAIARRKLFGVSILDDGQVDVARHFADPRRARDADQFGPDQCLAVSESGVPFVRGALAYLECRLYAMHPGGDHVVCVGQVLGTSSVPGRPLTFVTGRFVTALQPC